LLAPDGRLVNEKTVVADISDHPRRLQIVVAIILEFKLELAGGLCLQLEVVRDEMAYE
jgi:hypothetical protein